MHSMLETNIQIIYSIIYYVGNTIQYLTIQMSFTFMDRLKA